MRKKQPISVCARHLGCAFAFILCAASMKDARAATDFTASRVATAMRTIERFGSSHNPVDLNSAIDQLRTAYSLDALTPQHFVGDRRIIVKGFATAFVSIEKSYDPTFNPSRRLVCPPVPLNADGTLAASAGGECPLAATIHDESARSAYEAELKSYRLTAIASYRYNDINRIDNGAMATLEAILGQMNDVAPPNVTADFTALDAIVQQAGVSATRRARIDSFFYPLPANLPR